MAEQNTNNYSGNPSLPDSWVALEVGVAIVVVIIVILAYALSRPSSDEKRKPLVLNRQKQLRPKK